MRSYGKIEQDFPGGVYLPALGQLPPAEIVIPPVAPRLLLPLGLPGMPLSGPVDTVAPGRHCQAGECIAGQPDGLRVFAPVAGRTGQALTAWVHGYAGQPVVEFYPDDDRLDPPAEQPLPPSAMADKQAIWDTINAMGLFHTRSGERLASLLRELAGETILTVIANAASLEPEQSLPAALLRHYAARIFTGLAILKRWLNAPAAILAYPYYFPVDTAPAGQWEVRCVPVTDKYPQARDSSIIQTLTRQKVIRPGGGEGIAIFDLQTLYHVERAFFAQAAACCRFITLCGAGVSRPGHYFVPVGTPLAGLLELSGFEGRDCLVVSGSAMTGRRIDPDQTVIGPGDEAFVALTGMAEQRRHACIRCGRCIEGCPARLDPALLYRLIKEKRFDRSAERRLFDCIECGLCSYVCPSHLPILYKIQQAKSRIRSR